MKRFISFIAVALAIVASSCSKFDDTDIWNKLNEHEKRIVALEELCKQMNTNISSLQSIVNALQKNDYITNVSPVRKDGAEIGYTITFAYGDTITIYHGTNGKDGANGKDGKDGYTPQIGVMKDTDGIYYWTVDGEWLLDGKGNKVQANGVNGTTPHLKIENDYWYVSYDSGATWDQLDKATNANGIDFDTIFSSITQDDEYVYFNLVDGTTIKFSKRDNENIKFEDLQVKVLCCNNWDTNSDGELSYNEAAAVTSIGEVFKDNTNIIAFTELKYFTGLSEISASAFNKCTSLWKICLPQSISIIRERAFYNCSSLVTIIISNNVQYIEDYGFCNCSRLKNITLSNSLTNLGSSVFMNCTDLQNIVLPESIKEIGDGGFCQCSSLQKISIPNGITTLSDSLFSGCEVLYEVVIPDSVTKICDRAFYACTSLVNVTIPQYIYTIDGQAFGQCTELRNIYCKPLSPPNIYFHRDYSLNNYGAIPLNNNMTIYVPRESYNSYLQYSYNGNVSKSSIENWYFYESYIAPYDFE